MLAVKLYNAGGRHDVTEKTAFYMGTQLFATLLPGECVLQSTSRLKRKSQPTNRRHHRNKLMIAFLLAGLSSIQKQTLTEL